jgi:hypothetical protein
LISARRGHQERRSRVRELALAATIIEPDGSFGSFHVFATVEVCVGVEDERR